MNALNDDDGATDEDEDEDAGNEQHTMDGQRRKKEVLTADDMEYLDEFLGLDQLSPKAGNKRSKATRMDAADTGDDDCHQDIFGPNEEDSDNNDHGGDASLIGRRRRETLSEEEVEDLAYRERQQTINEDLDSRTGRLWTESWTITDEEWMADETWEDIEEWKPTLATRKSIESVHVYNMDKHTMEEEEGGGLMVRGVPTLDALSKLGLPHTLPPHPGHGAPALHARHRKKDLQRKLRTSIQIVIHDDVLKIVNHLVSYEERQAAVDVLYETIEERMRVREPVLCQLPDFALLVEEGLEDVLTMVQERMSRKTKGGSRGKKKGIVVAPEEEKIEKNEETTKGGDNVVVVDKNDIDVMGVNNHVPIPIFMDVLAATRHLQKLQQSPPQPSNDTVVGGVQPPPITNISKFFATTNEVGIPNLLYPLTNHPKDGVGRMAEEWQLAANKDTKRILMRDTLREIATIVVDATTTTTTTAIAVPPKVSDAAAAVVGEEVMTKTTGAARVLVTGKRGVGKSATLAGYVASARLSGHIVVYHPDGDRLRKHGYYIEPCPYRTGLYNLPEIAKEFCVQLLQSHGEDLVSPDFTNVVVSREEMAQFFSEDQIRRLFRRAHADDLSAGTITEDDVSKMTQMKLDTILGVGVNSSSLSSGCYSSVISKLMTQTVRPFTVVMDEYNCYYDHGHYFHMEYDESVRKAVPPNLITIFKPFMDAMGLYPTKAGTDVNVKTGLAIDPDKALMRWGSIVVGTSESRAVRDTFTQSLAECARALSVPPRGADDHPVPSRTHQVHVVEVRRYSHVEVQHILYNFEVTGIGRLRFDRGDTALNPEEVEYLRLVSGGCGQRLLDSCMLP